MDDNKLDKHKKEITTSTVGNIIANIGGICLLIGLCIAIYTYLGLITGLCAGGILLIIVGCIIAGDNEEDRY